MSLPILDDTTANDLWFPQNQRRGFDPTQVDHGMMTAPPATMKLVPRSEWSARCKEIKERRSGLRGAFAAKIPNIDQDGYGYCWGHSTAHAVAFGRVRDNQPYKPLSAFMVCSIVKRGRDEGGWCGLSAKFLREVGICTQDFWPQGTSALRYDTPAARANASLHRIDEDFADLTLAVYDQNLTFDQVMTCLFNRIPVAVDFNHWSHSVCAIEPVEVEPGSFGYWIRNSWSAGWGENGDSIMRGQKAVPDGAYAICSSLGSAE